MPQAELKYSKEIAIDAAALLGAIEDVIGAYDAGAGACKGRAFPIEITHHRHIYFSLLVLPKPHRDDAWVEGLSQKILDAIYGAISEPCHVAIEIGFAGGHYRTFPPKG